MYVEWSEERVYLYTCVIAGSVQHGLLCAYCIGTVEPPLQVL